MFESPLKWLLGGYLFAAGCVTSFSSSTPYTRERAIGTWNGNWFGDGNASVLEVYNPLLSPAEVGIECPNEDPPGYPADHYTALVEARSVKMVFIQKLNRDQWLNVCHVTGWNELR